ncbi:MAG TPA: glycosyltransferase [Candidatus Avibacteroides faecavium]|nr:glycosyltransferase [Candidatus Avibacteroides faecavium]
MKRLLQINPVLRLSTSTGRIMQEIGEIVIQNGWESYVAYSRGRDGILPCKSRLVPVGGKWSVLWHGVETRLFDRHGLASVGATKKFIEQIKEINPDVIHIHNIHGYFLNYPILFNYLSHCGIPVVWTIHDCWLYTGHCYHYSYAGCNSWQTGCHDCPQRREFPASLLFDRSERNFVDKRNTFTSMPKDKLVLVSVSDWIKKELYKSFLRKYDSRVIHNGINVDTFHVCDTRGVRERFNLQDKHILLGVASIWSKEKGLDDFIEMSRMLKGDELIVLVGIKSEDLKRLPHNIIGISRTENIHQLAELYSVADAFVNPTWQDNYPTVNMEAIACGTPVVTYRTGGSIESVSNQTGMIVEQGDVKGLLDAVRIIRQRGKSYYRPLCRSYALAHFKKEDCYLDYLHLYEELMMQC